jgi:hypothetical protein
METSAQELLRNMELLYENIYNLLIGFQRSTSSQNTNETITVQLRKRDGTFETVTVNSFQQIQAEINRIANNFSALTNSNGLSYILNSDGSISQFLKTSFINAEYIASEDIILGSEGVVSNNSLISDFMTPLVKIPVSLPTQLRTPVIARVYEIIEGWDNIQDNITLLELSTMISNGDVISRREQVKELQLQKEQIRYFGKFNVESVNQTSLNNYRLILNTVRYTGLNVNGNNIDLKIGDELITSSGSGRYRITNINIQTNVVDVVKVAGEENISVGINNLFFNQQVVSEDTIVGIPIKPLTKMVVFLSTESLSAVSYPSNGIKIDTSTYTVSYNNVTYTIDEFFGRFVINISDYLLSIAEENNIPASLGIRPNPPILDAVNFKVVQINKHVTNSKTVNEINLLNQQKVALQNEVDYKNREISNIRKDISASNYNTNEEKNQLLGNITRLRQEIDNINTEILTISRNIDNNANINSLKNIKPKYKVIGYWSIQDNLFSPVTGVQRIVKYEVEYRYLSQSSDVFDSTTVNMVDNGQEITVVFSPWNSLTTTVLTKSRNDQGEMMWEVMANDSIDQTNINQCAITINENEAVEIRLRAISEAGWPISPMKSDWSNIVKVIFPTSLKENNINSVIARNDVDLSTAEFENILQTRGIISHISNAVVESDRNYDHIASMITSGQFTPERKNIPLDECIKSIIEDVRRLQVTYSNPVSIELVDFDGNEFNISNGSIVKLRAPAYSGEYSIIDNTLWGSIVRKKAYIRLRNRNQVPIEIRSMLPGATNLQNQVFQNYYNDVPAITPYINSNNDLLNQQEFKQILYFRKMDLSRQSAPEFSLYEQDTSTVPTDNNNLPRNGSNPNVFLFDGSGPVLAEYNAINHSTPTTAVALFANDAPMINGNIDIAAEFRRISKLTSILKSSKQNQLTINGAGIGTLQDIDRLGFDDNDMFAVGMFTCGAFLYPQLPAQRIQVAGDSVASSVVLEVDSEILIPLIFEYRMVDRLGNINGINMTTINNFSYSKTLGVDLIINNVPFNFDINAVISYK